MKMWIIGFLTAVTLICGTALAADTYQLQMLQEQKIYRSRSTLPESQRFEYIDLEKSLWQYLGKKTSNQSQQKQLKKVIESHYSFVNDNLLLQRELNLDSYKILTAHSWSLIERDLIQIDKYFQFFKDTLDKFKNETDYDERALLDVSETILKNDKTFSIARIFNEIEVIMVNQAFYYWILTESTDQICETQQSPQQFVYSLYTDIALTELKGYTMVQYSWMILKLYGRGNFTQESDLMRQDYESRTERTLKRLREVMRSASRIVWRCDPNKHIKGKTYDEVTRLLQGYIENEVDLNNDETCRETCDYYQHTRSEGCFKKKYCARQPRCHGKLHQCTFVDSDMWVCPGSYNSTRRYEYIEYENGRVLGKKKTCSRGTSKVDSWWRYLFWHCSYCFCLCDEQGLKSDRYFNLREYTTDVDNNKVLTGLRFVKHNRVFHLQIQEAELLPRGNINQSSVSWRALHDYRVFDPHVTNGKDFHILSYERRSIDLDDVYTTDNSFLVTGVRFRLVGVHLNLEARLTEFDFETGKLINPTASTYWKSNDNTDVSGERRQKLLLHNPDIPTESPVRSTPDSEHNQYIDFINSSMDKDAAQSTVPFVDIQDVFSNPPVPLSGVGLYHKGVRGYGGFVAPKIISYDFAPHVLLPKSIV